MRPIEQKKTELLRRALEFLDDYDLRMRGSAELVDKISELLDEEREDSSEQGR